MAFDFKFPDVGEGIHEGKIVKWLIKEGDEVKADQSIAEVETDKAIVEIPTPKSGKIVKLYHKEAETIKVGEVLATIEESVSAKGSSASGSEPTAEKADTAGVVGSLEPTAAGVMKAPNLDKSGAVFGGGPVFGGAAVEAPKAVPMAEPVKPDTQGKPSETKASSGPSAVGVIKSGIKAVKKYDLFGYVDHLSYDSVRKAVGDHMVKSVYTIPHVTHMDTVDVTELFKVREREKEKAEKKGIKLTFLAFFLKAAVCALQKHPLLNASLDEENKDIIIKKYFNIGIAVDTEAGLMAPVIKVAQNKSIFQIAQEIVDLAEKARSRKINPMDLKGGTFTLSNIGSIGGEYFTPIINYPQSAILGIGSIKDVPAARSGKTAIRKVVYLSLSFDHRIIDGAEAARFMNTLKEYLEDPDFMLMENK